MVFVATVILLFLSPHISTMAEMSACTTNYYWRDYYGIIPRDAVPAGKNHNGDTLYIGIFYLYGVGLLPATIFPRQKLARTVAYENVLNTDKGVKILCSPHKEAFEWVSIESKDLHKYINRNLIPGLSEVEEHLYIGRIFRNNDVIVGKIYKLNRIGRDGIWFPVENTITRSLSYDILLYNCDKVTAADVDVRFGNKTY